jgi:hypothetical protein
VYAHCIHCRGHLGANEALGVFPVGRRLAFDESRGRLWVVCDRCTRWNLSPLEERWEAIEACERAFRDSRRRVGTEHISLAVVPEGLELVRVGPAKRPELAAWRYGGQLLQRRRVHRVRQAVDVLGYASMGLPLTLPLDVYRNRRLVATASDAEGRRVEIRGKQAKEVRLRPTEDADGWLLAVPHGSDMLEFRGREAIRLAGPLLVGLNRAGANAEEVETAVKELEAAGGAEAFFAVAARKVDRHEGWALMRPYEHRLRKSPLELRLAVEMAAHEESERRALEGELAALEDAWREAEAVAAIADDLLIPPAVRRAFERLRHAATGRQAVLP